MNADQKVSMSYAIRLALAFGSLKYKMERCLCTQDEAIAEVSVEFSVQPEDVEACVFAKTGAQ